MLASVLPQWTTRCTGPVEAVHGGVSRSYCIMIVVLLWYQEEPPDVEEKTVRKNRPSNFHTTPGAIVGQCPQSENLCQVSSEK